MATDSPNPQLTVERIYLRDASFESPRAPAVFAAEWQPQVQVDINSRNQRIDDQRYEVLLTLTLEAKNLGEVAMIVELQQAGIFRLQDIDDALRDSVLATTCPATLFPYLRESLDSLVVKGSFPPIMLAPVNFDALYAEAKRRWEEENNQASPIH